MVGFWNRHCASRWQLERKDKRGHREHACVVIETSMGGASSRSSPFLLQPLATTGAELGTESFHSHLLPQVPNSEPKAVAGCRRRSARCGETDMSESAGSCHVSRRGRVSVCCPRPLAQRRKAREAKRAGSAQPLAQSIRSVDGSDLDGPSRFPPWDWKIGFKIKVLCPEGQSMRLGPHRKFDFHVLGFGRWGGEVGSGGVAAPLAVARRGRIRLDLVED